jgi:hypothetical protein
MAIDPVYMSQGVKGLCTKCCVKLALAMACGVVFDCLQTPERQAVRVRMASTPAAQSTAAVPHPVTPLLPVAPVTRDTAGLSLTPSIAHSTAALTQPGLSFTAVRCLILQAAVEGNADACASSREHAQASLPLLASLAASVNAALAAAKASMAEGVVPPATPGMNNCTLQLATKGNHRDEH